MYGQLPKCPICNCGQLKVDIKDQNYILRPGYNASLGKNKITISCDIESNLNYKYVQKMTRYKIFYSTY